jgi:hypothetical protein
LENLNVLIFVSACIQRNNSPPRDVKVAHDIWQFCLEFWYFYRIVVI